MESEYDIQAGISFNWLNSCWVCVWLGCWGCRIFFIFFNYAYFINTLHALPHPQTYTTPTLCYIAKRMALDVIEDALTDIDNPHGRGMATGLCGAFYMCGLISEEEWLALL